MPDLYLTTWIWHTAGVVLGPNHRCRSQEKHKIFSINFNQVKIVWDSGTSQIGATHIRSQWVIIHTNASLEVLVNGVQYLWYWPEFISIYHDSVICSSLNKKIVQINKKVFGQLSLSVAPIKVITFGTSEITYCLSRSNIWICSHMCYNVWIWIVWVKFRYTASAITVTWPTSISCIASLPFTDSLYL